MRRVTLKYSHTRDNLPGKMNCKIIKLWRRCCLELNQKINSTFHQTTSEKNICSWLVPKEYLKVADRIKLSWRDNMIDTRVKMINREIWSLLADLGEWFLIIIATLDDWMLSPVNTKILTCNSMFHLVIVQETHINNTFQWANTVKEEFMAHISNNNFRIKFNKKINSITWINMTENQQEL